jgi:hypothetical protein
MMRTDICDLPTLERLGDDSGVEERRLREVRREFDHATERARQAEIAASNKALWDEDDNRALARALARGDGPGPPAARDDGRVWCRWMRYGCRALLDVAAMEKHHARCPRKPAVRSCDLCGKWYLSAQDGYCHAPHDLAVWLADMSAEVDDDEHAALPAHIPPPLWSIVADYVWQSRDPDDFAVGMGESDVDVADALVRRDWSWRTRQMWQDRWNRPIWWL